MSASSEMSMMSVDSSQRGRREWVTAAMRPVTARGQRHQMAANVALPCLEFGDVGVVACPALISATSASMRCTMTVSSWTASASRATVCGRLRSSSSYRCWRICSLSSGSCAMAFRMFCKVAMGVRAAVVVIGTEPPGNRIDCNTAPAVCDMAWPAFWISPFRTRERCLR